MENVGDSFVFIKEEKIDESYCMSDSSYSVKEEKTDETEASYIQIDIKEHEEEEKTSCKFSLSKKCEQIHKTQENHKDTVKRKPIVHNETKSDQRTSIRGLYKDWMLSNYMNKPWMNSGNLHFTRQQKESPPGDFGSSGQYEENFSSVVSNPSRFYNKPYASNMVSTSLLAKRKDRQFESHPPSKRLKENYYSSVIFDTEKKDVDLTECFSRQRNKYEDDSDCAFFMSLLPYVKLLSPIEKLKLRTKIMGDVTDSLEQYYSVNKSHIVTQ